MRTPPKPLSAYAWRTEHELRFADMDQLGHINNGAYGSFMESSRSLMCIDCGLTGSISVALVRIELDFLKEMRWPGRIVAASAVESIGRSSFRLRQAVFKDEVCTAEAMATLCLLNLTTRRAEPIDDAIRERLLRWSIG